jgi:hypothetical protein
VAQTTIPKVKLYLSPTNTPKPVTVSKFVEDSEFSAFVTPNSGAAHQSIVG